MIYLLMNVILPFSCDFVRRCSCEKLVTINQSMLIDRCVIFHSIFGILFNTSYNNLSLAFAILQ